MKNQKALLAVVLVLALVVVMAPAARAQDTYPLIAGNPKNGTQINVGEVQVSNDASFIYVRYFIYNLTPTDPTDDWWISEAHVAVMTDPNLFPQKNGNPIPGRFGYPNPYLQDPWVTYLEVKIPHTFVPGNAVYIAAHAVVGQLGGLEALAYSLPDTATLSVTYPYGGGPAYFPTMTITNGGILNGLYQGWCVDTDHTIGQNTNYTANVYSSYEALPAGLVEYPENMDLVNWILNQNYIGQPSAGCGGFYTYGDVQRAIWELVEDTPSTSGLGSWSQCRVDEIKAAAQASGEGFVPGCGDKVAVILAPVSGAQVIIAQVVLTLIGVPCEGVDETAWAGIETQSGYAIAFPGANWALYFNYVIK